MTCDECRAACEWPEHRVFDPLCLWCGARCFQMLKTWPPARDVDDGNGSTRPETREERQAWRADVLRRWAAHGHSAERMKELAAGEAMPIEPQPKRRR